MPRREHIIHQTDFIDFLRSIGCIIYIPLSENDFQEKITGNYLSFSGYGSLAWDANKQMYLATNPSYGRYVASLAFPYNASDFVDNGFTKCFTFEKVSTNGGFATLGRSYSQDNPLTMVVKPGTAGVASWASGKHTDLFIEASYRQGFEDDVQYSYSTTPATSNRPNSWANNTSTIYLCPAIKSDHANRQSYISNIMIFNKGLSESEIHQLYSLL